MLKRINVHSSDNASYAAEFFAKAHDYLLMSNEEEGGRLTADFLDDDNRETPGEEDDEIATKKLLCSEVSRCVSERSEILRAST